MSWTTASWRPPRPAEGYLSVRETPDARGSRRGYEALADFGFASCENLA
jgi:hypothetical protein